MICVYERICIRVYEFRLIIITYLYAHRENHRSNNVTYFSYIITIFIHFSFLLPFFCHFHPYQSSIEEITTLPMVRIETKNEMVHFHLMVLRVLKYQLQRKESKCFLRPLWLIVTNIGIKFLFSIYYLNK